MRYEEYLAFRKRMLELSAEESAFKVYQEIISSIADGLEMDWEILKAICEAVDFTSIDSLYYEGYVEVHKVTDSKGKEFLSIRDKYLKDNPQLYHQSFSLQDGIGVLQYTNGLEDSYKGQLLLPLKQDKWLCVSYTC